MKMVGMAQEHDEELHGLRLRAYGPHADIHLDADALQRLRHLEGTAREEPTPSATDNDVIVAEEPSSSRDVAPVEAPTLTWAEQLSRIPRRTILLFLGVVAVGLIIAGVPVLIDRVQTDSLNVGADQVARLSVDPSYAVPATVSQPATSDNPAGYGFDLFHGLRVVKSNFVVDGGGDTACVFAYEDAKMKDSETTSIPRFILNGCSAGGFAATVQFQLTMYGVPKELIDEFPGTTALQFVYDRTHDEVVVFAQRK